MLSQSSSQRIATSSFPESLVKSRRLSLRILGKLPGGNFEQTMQRRRWDLRQEVPEFLLGKSLGDFLVKTCEIEWWSWPDLWDMMGIWGLGSPMTMQAPAVSSGVFVLRSQKHKRFTTWPPETNTKRATRRSEGREQWGSLTKSWRASGANGKRCLCESWGRPWTTLVIKIPGVFPKRFGKRGCNLRLSPWGFLGILENSNRETARSRATGVPSAGSIRKFRPNIERASRANVLSNLGEKPWATRAKYHCEVLLRAWAKVDSI